VIGALHESTPDVASVPLQLIPTGWLYQPAWSGMRAAFTVTAGPVASYWKPSAAVEVLPAASVQLPLEVAFASSGPP
jgi:hypothetical protein